MMPGKGDVFSDDDFPIIVEAMPGRECRFRHLVKIGAVTGREAKIPHLIGAKTKTAAEGGVLKIRLSHVPIIRMRRKGRILHLHGIIELTKPAGQSYAAGVAWTPNQRYPHLLITIFIRSDLARIGPDMRPIQKSGGAARSNSIPKPHEII